MNGHDGNRGREGWSWGLPYIPRDGRFAPQEQAAEYDWIRGAEKAQYDWIRNAEHVRVDDRKESDADKTDISGGPRPLPYASRWNRESCPTRSGNYEQIFKVQVRRFCCEGCVNKVEKRVRNIPGISSAHCNLEHNTVTVVGTVDPELILTTLETIKYLDPKLLSQVDST